MVDEIGGLHEAIAWASQEAKLEKPDVKLLPAPKSGLQGLFSKPHKKDDDEIIRATVGPSPASQLRAMISGSGALEALPEPAKSAVVKLASRLEAFRKSPVLLIGPDFNLR